MEEENIRNFYDISVEFCNYIKQTVISKNKIEDLIEKLMDLYMHGMKLPLPTTIDLSNGKFDYSALPEINVTIDFDDSFRAMENPLDVEEEVAEKYCLSELLTSIGRKLMAGISMYDSGYEKKAIFEWTTMLALTLGASITDAIRALHSFRTEYALTEWIDNLSGK